MPNFAFCIRKGFLNLRKSTHPRISQSLPLGDHKYSSTGSSKTKRTRVTFDVSILEFSWMPSQNYDRMLRTLLRKVWRKTWKANWQTEVEDFIFLHHGNIIMFWDQRSSETIAFMTRTHPPHLDGCPHLRFTPRDQFPPVRKVWLHSPFPRRLF